MLGRFPLWCLYSILTCWCDDGGTVELVDVAGHDHLVSFDYVTYHLERLQNFQHIPIGRQEIEFNRTLRHVRTVSRA